MRHSSTFSSVRLALIPPEFRWGGVWSDKAGKSDSALLALIVKRRLTIEEMNEAAERFGGKCLSSIYVNNLSHLQWQCSIGHKWSAIPMSVRKGHWCPICASKSRGVRALLSDGLERCRVFAEKRGGSIITKKYLGSTIRIKVDCGAGHQWMIAPSNLWAGKWCPYCSGNKLDKPLKALAELALLRGGRMVSNNYLGTNIRHAWECSAGHRWLATPSSVKRGSWCSRCAGFKPKSEWYDLMDKAVAKHGGRIISASSSFKGPREPNVLIECSEGHRWRTCCYNIVSKRRWCKSCRLSLSVKKLNLQDMHNLAAKHGGRCISKKYSGSTKHLEWQCASGHLWKAKPSNIGSGRWCPVCKLENLSAHFRRKDSLEFYAAIASSRGGRVLTVEEPRNAQQKLLWECARGHRWLAKANNVQNGKWCPTCSTGYGERICRVYFEDLFSQPFPSTWPNWLIINGTRRQLDGYCPQIRLAFEHQGEQHYKKLLGTYFARTSLLHRKKVDREKMRLCHENGVKLIQVPGIPTMTKLADLREFIYKACKKYHVEVPDDFFTREINLSRAWNYDLIERLTTAAASKGGKCLSHEFVGLNSKYLWECLAGHRWEALGTNIIHRKSWCPKCHFIKLRKKK